MLNIMLVEGVAVAVPAALLGALLQALLRRHRSGTRTTRRARRPAPDRPGSYCP